MSSLGIILIAFGIIYLIKPNSSDGGFGKEQQLPNRYFHRSNMKYICGFWGQFSLLRASF
jgi:hypothetical protein